jgi:hypothetical protein
MNPETGSRRKVLQDSIDTSLLLEREAQIASREVVIARLKALLVRALPVILKDAQNGSSDSEALHNDLLSLRL